MPDPEVRHLVCPVCHSHIATIDGTFVAHPSADASGANCTGTGQSTTGKPYGRNYSNGSNFQSCPAATGIPYLNRVGCPHFPDRAHRCGEDREHMSYNDLPPSDRAHQCTCGWRWSTVGGSPLGVDMIANGLA